MEQLKEEIRILEKQYIDIGCELFNKRMKLTYMNKQSYLNLLQDGGEEVCVQIVKRNWPLNANDGVYTEKKQVFLYMPKVWGGVKRVVVRESNWRNDVCTILEMIDGKKKTLSNGEHKGVVEFIRELEKGETVIGGNPELEIIWEFDHIDC